jgi:alanine racemase
MRDTSVVEIDLAAIGHNMAVLRRIVGPDCLICPVVKADAYGLGAVRVARMLLHAGASMLAVYTRDEVAEIFGAALGGPVLVLMPVRSIDRADEVYRGLVCGRLHLSVHDLEHLEDLVRMAERFAVSIPLHLEIDTGLSRGGCPLDDVPRVLERIAAHPRLVLAGIYTHFAAADTDPDLTDVQDERFETLLREHAALIPSDCLVHVANTGAALGRHAYHKSMIRVGQAWAGYGPETIRHDRVLEEAWELRPAVSWSSEIIQLKRIERRAKVGYGAAWTARRPSLLGLVPVGYADGYPSALGRPDRDRRPPVNVSVVFDTADGPQRVDAPVVGRVSMDQITIDLTDVETSAPGRDGLRVGVPVELITPHRDATNHLVRLAEAAGEPPYEMLCRLNPRIRRVYHQARPVVEVVPAAREAVVAG